MYPHRIRLGAPWERHELPAGRVQFRRRFGRPRQLDDWERVWLLRSNREPNQVWQLNGTDLSWRSRHDAGNRAEITEMLRDRNELVVEDDAGSSFDGAILEIACRAWIEQMRATWQREQLLIDVSVQSETADDPLEIYVSLNGENRGYWGPFTGTGIISHEFQVAHSIARATEVSVELICRSTVWDGCAVQATTN